MIGLESNSDLGPWIFAGTPDFRAHASPVGKRDCGHERDSVDSEHHVSPEGRESVGAMLPPPYVAPLGLGFRVESTPDLRPGLHSFVPHGAAIDLLRRGQYVAKSIDTALTGVSQPSERWPKTQS